MCSHEIQSRSRVEIFAIGHVLDGVPVGFQRWRGRRRSSVVSKELLRM